MKSDPNAVLSAKSLHYFLRLIDNMSYTQTANSLGITQPALTQQVKKLERAVGAPLFAQIGKKLALTPAGLELEKTAHKLFETVNEAVDNIQQYSQPDVGHISIGVLNIMEARVLEEFIIHYHQLYPNITISTESFSRGELWSKLDTGEIDIAMTYLPDKGLSKEMESSYQVTKIYSDYLVFLSRGSSDQTNEELINKKWVSYNKDSYLQQVMKQYYDLHELDHAPKVVARFSSAYQVVQFAQAGNDYNTFVPNSFYQVHRDKLLLQPVHLNPVVYFDNSFVTRKSKKDIPRIEQFKQKWNEFLAQKSYVDRLKDVETF